VERKRKKDAGRGKNEKKKGKKVRVGSLVAKQRNNNHNGERGKKRKE